MKTLTFTLFLFFFSGFLFAQESEKALASISYEFIHVNDTNNRENPRKEEMIVYLGQYGSVYKSLTLAKKMEEMEARMKEMAIPTAPGGKSTFRLSSPNFSNDQLFLLPREKRLALLDRIGESEYQVDLKFPAIDWEIGDETKQVGGYECQQAKGSFGGRNYTVWFTSEIPFPYGPWKLHGLPGLILEAEDSKQEVFFRFQDFGKLEGIEISVSIPKEAIKTNPKAFEKAKEAFEKNPMIGRSAGAGAISRMITVGKDGVRREISGDEALAAKEQAKRENERKNNNPLEIL